MLASNHLAYLSIGWTQEGMAAHDFSIRFYQRIEAGKPLLHLRTVFRLAEVFGVRAAELFGE